MCVCSLLCASCRHRRLQHRVASVAARSMASPLAPRKARRRLRRRWQQNINLVVTVLAAKQFWRFTSGTKQRH
eukprot:1724838-Pleurochrysis_carterae.AAC.2